MNIYCLAAIVFGVASFSVGFEVLIRRKDYVGVCYFIVSGLYAVWGTSVGVGISGALSFENSLFQARLHNGAALFVPIAWFHFVAVYTNDIYWKDRAIWFYLIPLPVALFFNTNFFVSGLQQSWIFPYYAKPGILFHLSPMLFFLMIPLSFKMLLRDLKKYSMDEKNKREKFIVIAAIGYLAGSLTYFSVYGFNVPQYGLLALPVYPFGLSYFISSSGLFDEERLAQAAHKDKLAALGMVTASMNHEIRSPLFLMRGMIETEGKDSPLANKLLSQINRVTEIVSRLTHFAKKGVDEEAKIESLDLKEILSDIRPLFQHQLNYQNIEYTQDIPVDLPKVMADRRYLEEILFNLILNSCQALKNTPNPKVTLTGSVLGTQSRGLTPMISSDSRFTNYAVRGTSSIAITIEDNGPGIPPDQQKNIFKPFHTTKSEGTGLGLYITKQLVEKCGGKIEVQSELNKGAQFIVTLKPTASDAFGVGCK